MENQIILNNMLFDVEKVNFQETFGMATNSDYSHAIIGKIEGENKVLNVCSDRYELVKNAEIFPQIRQILNDAGLQFSEKYSMVNHARFYADYVIESESTHIGAKNDIVKPLIRVRHSYNGLTKYAITFGYFRLVCDNGLVVPIEGKEATNLHIVGKHTISIRTSLDMLIQRLENFTINQNFYKQNFDILGGQWVENPLQRISEVLEFAKIPEKKAEQVLSTVLDESAKLYDGKVNDWLIYNGVNQLIHKGDNKKVLEQKELYDYKAIEYLLKH